jgi:hypothetical protein
VPVYHHRQGILVRRRMAKQALVILFTVLAFGILVPWYKGFTFLDPRMVAAYGCLAVLFVAPASAEAFAGERNPASSGAILGRLVALIGFGSRLRASFSRRCSHAAWRLRRRWEP